MAELTLGQLLDVAIGAPKTEPIDFEQLRNLLNGMLVNLGLRDLPVQESGEPLEGTPTVPSISSVFADIEQLKQRTEDNEREIAEVRAVCEELREEIKVLKEEHSHMVENMQDMTNFQDMLDSLRNELMSTVMDMMGQNGQVSPDPHGSTHAPVWKDHGLIVIGNEITLAERVPRTSSPRHRDTAGSSPVPSRSKVGTQDRGKDVPPGVTGSPQVSFMARGTGLHNVGQTKDEETKMGISKGAAFPSPKAWSRGKNLPHGDVSSPQVPFTGSDMGWNDTGQIKDREINRGISKGAVFPSSKTWSRERNLPHGVTSSPRVSLIESDVGWRDVEQIKDEEIKTSISKAESLPRPQGVPYEMDMEQIKDEEIKMSVSKAESLPSPQGVPYEMDMEQIKDEKIKTSISKAGVLPRPQGAPYEMDMEQIKDEDTEMNLSKAPPHIRTKTLDGHVTALGVHPGSPHTHMPIQPGLSVQGHAISQSLWVPAESVSGSNRFLTATEARGGGSFRMEPSQLEPGMKVLKVPSHEYLPSDQPFTTQLPGPCSPPRSPVLSGLSPPSPGSPALLRRSDIISYTPPPSPGLTGRLPHLAKQDKEQGQRGQAAEGYSRRSPMYCGGRHTSVCPVQPMEPLLLNPSTPGAFDLVGRDGLIYRGRQSRAPMGSSVEGARYSKLQ